LLINNIFNSLINSSNYFSIVFPHLDEKYFGEKVHSNLFIKVKDYHLKYNKIPKISDLKLLIEMDNNVSESDSEELYTYLDSLKSIEKVSDENLLIKETENYTQQRALELAVLASVEVIQNPKESNGKIEDLIKQALSIEFDVKIGDDYFKDVKKRMESYLETEDKIALDIDLLNQAMGGGLVKKAIFFFMANTGVGKSIFLAHSAGSLVRSGKNVLYLTGELSTKEVGKRIDANLLDIPINTLNQNLDKAKFKNSVKDLFSKSHGELIIKYCSAGSTTAIHIKNLINEIKLKKGFVPDVIILDHLTLFGSSRVPKNQSGTPLYIRSVVEEIRDVAIEFDCCILTACQLTRGSKSKNTDVTNEDVGLAYAISETSDWSAAIIQTSELKEQLKFLVKVMKTRFSSTNEQIYTVGISYDHMRLMNLGEEDQEIPLHIKDKLKFEKEQQNQKEESTLYSDFNFAE
jgi:archaellum biogenesis ATPase FlaH